MNELKEIIGLSDWPRSLLGKCEGPLVIIGPAVNVWDEVEKYGQATSVTRMAINEMIPITPVFLSSIHHAVSMHPEVVIGGKIMVNNHGIHCHTHSMRQYNSRDSIEHLWGMRGITHSGLFGAVIAVLMGYYPVVLCGMPADDSPYCYGPKSWRVKWHEGETAHGAWKPLVPVLKGKVFSMSGNTRKWFGAP